jgi:hypothetical protein
MDDIRGFFSTAANKIKSIFKKKNLKSDPPKIVIGQITQHPSTVNLPQVSTQDEASLKITIGTIHQRPPREMISPIEGDVVQGTRDLGNGMHINHQSKPKICPICRSHGSVIKNTSGRSMWKCNDPDCGAEF